MNHVLSILLSVLLLLCTTAATSEEMVTEENPLIVENLLCQMEAAAETGDVLLANVLKDQIFRLGDQEAWIRADELVLAATEKSVQQKRSEAQREPSEETAVDQVNGAELFDTVIEMGKTENVAMGDTVTLADAISFRIPADWEKKQAEEDVPQDINFLYLGRDEEGTGACFIGMSFDIGEATYATALQSLREQGYQYRILTVNGIDMILTGNDMMTAGVCVTADGDAIAFGFVNDQDVQSIMSYGSVSHLSEMMSSEKLLRDMIAIFHSVSLTGRVEIVPMTENSSSGE